MAIIAARVSDILLFFFKYIQKMGNTVNFTINFNSNAEAFTNGLLNVTGKLKGQMDTLSTTFGKFKEDIIVFQQAAQLVRDFGETLKSVTEPGLKLNTSLTDLAAITGVKGNQLKEIGFFAFGNVHTQKLLTSRVIECQHVIDSSTHRAHLIVHNLIVDSIHPHNRINGIQAPVAPTLNLGKNTIGNRRDSSEPVWAYDHYVDSLIRAPLHSGGHPSRPPRLHSAGFQAKGPIHHPCQ